MVCGFLKCVLGFGFRFGLLRADVLFIVGVLVCLGALFWFYVGFEVLVVVLRYVFVWYLGLYF